jgi:predicted RNA binding protein YcfA (HicA-like mRNA interferase family)
VCTRELLVQIRYSCNDLIPLGEGHPESFDAMKLRDLLRLLTDDGWYLVRTRGSHQQYRHPVKQGLVTLAGHGNDDVAPRTLKSVLKQAGLEKKP